MSETTSILPLVFAGLMALSLLMYAILDGFDLGVGILLPLGDEAQRDTMLASIGPFWDANETWLVLGIGLLLIAFPEAHGIILGELYLDVLILLVGLILRGVAFDFRAKVPSDRKGLWDRLFFIGSLMAALSQGYMLGQFVVGFQSDLWSELFSLLSAVCVASAYTFIGGSWLIMKTAEELQQRVVSWVQACLWLMMLGITAVSIVNPIISPEIFAKWFALPQIIVLLPIPLLCGAALLGTSIYLNRLKHRNDEVVTRSDWIPFAAAIVIFLLSFQGLAYSFYPYIVPFEITIWDAAAAPESLAFMGIGVAVVFPLIILYTALSYRVFWGKATELRYY